jgi:hypothetical protein
MFDSEEEVEVYMWIIEAKGHGIVDSFLYHPDSYLLTPKQTRNKYKQLKNKEKLIVRSVFQKHEYTSDFRIWFNKRVCPFKYTPSKHAEYNDCVEIDVKGMHQKHGGDKIFSINQKLVYNEYGVYINKIIPIKLFSETWRPAQAGLTKVHKDVQKSYKDFLTIDRYLQLRDA